MFNSLLGGSGMLGNAQNSQSIINPGLAQNGYTGSIYASNYAQQSAANAYNAALQKNQHRYMINCRTMTWDQFLDELAPGDDNPMRSFLTLKYKGMIKSVGVAFAIIVPLIFASMPIYMHLLANSVH